MCSRQCQPAAADRPTDQTVEVQQQGLGDGFGTVPQHCPVHTRYATLALLVGVRTRINAYGHLCEGRQQC